MASSFLDRVIDLKKSTIGGKYTSTAHEFGVRYKKLNADRDSINVANLFVQLISSDDPRKTESETLEKYVADFGELPPLNRSS